MNNDLGGVVLGFNADGVSDSAEVPIAISDITQVINLGTVHTVAIKELATCYRVWLCCSASSHRKQARDFHERIEEFFKLPDYSDSNDQLKAIFSD